MKIYYALDLKDDPALIEQYINWHRPGAIPSAVTQSIRDAGIEGLEIFLLGNRLMMVLTPGKGFDPEKKAASDLANPEVQAWESLMWNFQQALPFAEPGQKWLRMTKIYDLGDQPL